MKIIAPLLLLAVTLNGASAYPSGAGGCSGGQAAVRGSHLQSGYETGFLVNGGFAVILDGNTLDHEKDGTVSFTAGEDHTLTVTGRYTGILVRLQAESGVDTSAALSETSSFLQDASVCSAPVVGISHNSRASKNGAEIILRLDEPSDVALDITIVLENEYGGSIFYYSGFALRAVDPPGTISSAGGTPTPAPVSITAMPVAVADTAIRTSTSAPTLTFSAGSAPASASSAGCVSSLAAYRGAALTSVVSIHLLSCGFWFW
jgi:hypothetical protein